MTLRARGGLLLTGLVVVLYGYAMLQKHGIFPYLNAKMQPVYPAGVIVFGIVIAAFSLLPTGDWVYRRISTKRRRDAHVLHMIGESRDKPNGRNHSST